jgi:large subunit ribosomal protein L10
MTDKKFNPRKSSAISEITDLLSNSKSVAVVDYTGMTVSQATDLRKAVRKAGGEIKVTKNTLFKIALKNKDLDLQGLNAFVFSNSDEVSAIKTVSDFAKKAGVLKFRMGLLGDKILSEKEITALAAVPSKETLLTRLAFSMNWTISQFARTLDAISKKEVTNS